METSEKRSDDPAARIKAFFTYVDEYQDYVSERRSKPAKAGKRVPAVISQEIRPESPYRPYPDDSVAASSPVPLQGITKKEFAMLRADVEQLIEQQSSKLGLMIAGEGKKSFRSGLVVNSAFFAAGLLAGAVPFSFGDIWIWILSHLKG